MAWTTPGTATAGDVLTAAFWNTQVRDNFTATHNASTGVLLSSAMPVGSVIQAVNGTTSTHTTKSSSTTFTDTNLSVSITPTSTSHKILIIVFQAGINKTANDIVVRLKLLRGSTDLIEFESAAGGNGSVAFNGVGAAGATYLDSPATTSSVTYKTQYAANSASGTIAVQGLSASTCTSTITALEIRA